MCSQLDITMGANHFYLPLIGNADFHYLVKMLPNFLIL